MANDLTPPSGPRMSRRRREDRGFRLGVVGGAAAVAAVVTAVLAIAGVLGWGLPFLALIVAVSCALLFRRLASRR